jgi:hypothetical protein
MDQADELLAAEFQGGASLADRVGRPGRLRGLFASLIEEDALP